MAPITSLLASQTPATSQTPKAFINYILFDDQFKCTGGGFAPVGTNGTLTDYASASALHNIPVTKNGFVYIYCSNESAVDVFFDNVQVVHTRGPILEETHYYPFGLTMAGISSKAAGGLENKKGFNGNEIQNKEFSDGSGLDFSRRRCSHANTLPSCVRADGFAVKQSLTTEIEVMKLYSRQPFSQSAPVLISRSQAGLAKPIQ